MQGIAMQPVSADPETHFQDVQHLSSSFQFVGNVVDPSMLLEPHEAFFGVHFPELGSNKEPLFSHFSVFNTETGDEVQRYQLPTCSPRGLINLEANGFYMYDEEGAFFHLLPGEDNYQICNTIPPHTQIEGAVYSRFDNEIYGTARFENGKKGGACFFNWSQTVGLKILAVFESNCHCPYLFEGHDGSLCGVISASTQHPDGCFIQIDEQKAIQEVFTFPQSVHGDKFMIEGTDQQFYGVAVDFTGRKSQIFKLDSQGNITLLLQSSNFQVKPLHCDGECLYLLSERNRYRKEFVELNLSTLKVRKFGVESPSGRLHRIVKQNNEFLTFALQPSFDPKSKTRPITILTQPGTPLVPFVRGIL